MTALAQLTLERDAKAAKLLAELGRKIAARIVALRFNKTGQDIRPLAPELAGEATGGIGLAMAAHGVPLSALIGGTLPREIVSAGFKAAQAILRKMSRAQSIDLVSWDDAMSLADDAAKPMLSALHDSLVRRDMRAAIIAKARAMIRAARAFHLVNASRQRDAALRADLRNIRRATAYMIRHVLGDASQPFEFQMAMRWSESERSMTNAMRQNFQRTAKRVALGNLALQ